MKDDDILDEIRKTRQEMDMFMNEMIGFSRISLYKHTYYNPPIDIYETSKEFIINAELPGMTKEEIIISIADDVLYIKGERKIEEKRNKLEMCYYHMEINYGPFERRIRIPRNININKMKISLKNGILTIILPLKAKIIKRIEIQ